MEELSRKDLEDWLDTHGMTILAVLHEPQFVWLYHRDTQRGNWVRTLFIKRVVNDDAGIWPMEYFARY
jgi:hypothetical protein